MKYFYVFFSAGKFSFFDKIMIFRSWKSEREEIGVREITIFATMKIKLTDTRYIFKNLNLKLPSLKKARILRRNVINLI